MRVRRAEKCCINLFDMSDYGAARDLQSATQETGFNDPIFQVGV